MNSKEKNTALTYAVTTKDRLRVEHLHRLGVDMDKPVNGFNTPLILAIGKEDYETVRLLVDLGADPTKSFMYRCGPMDNAKRLKDDNKMVNLLRELEAKHK